MPTVHNVAQGVVHMVEDGVNINKSDGSCPSSIAGVTCSIPMPDSEQCAKSADASILSQEVLLFHQ